MKNIFFQWLADFALLATKFNGNTAGVFTAHQPKLPEGAKKLRKF